MEGFVAQLKGRLTKRRYIGATVFRDHAKGFIQVALLTNFTRQATIDACNEFEVLSRNMGVDVKHYHCDNGRFADNLSIENIKQNNQSISFCRVGAHHQNGRAEKRIRDLRDSARKLLLHAISRWPKVIYIHLWPYALRQASHVSNMIPDNIDDNSKLERFAQINIAIKQDEELPHL